VGKHTIEDTKQLRELRKLIVEDDTKFDVILSNPPFSMNYSRDKADQAQILAQYLVAQGSSGKPLSSVLSSVMFLERYKDLVKDDGRVFAIIDESVLSGQSYFEIRNFIRDNFIIIGVISLPGDAFRRASARVKTSILILRLRKPGETQPDVFMTSAIYIGIEEKTARRIGMDKVNLREEKIRETDRIVSDFRNFCHGVGALYSVPATQITDRLDVKFCINDRGRKKPIWLSNGLNVIPIGNALSIATGRQVKVDQDEVYQFLRVTYDGDVTQGDAKDGSECSYSTLYRVKEWDILLSNMGVGRGAVAIVPTYHSGKFVSNEYTIVSRSRKSKT